MAVSEHHTEEVVSIRLSLPRELVEQIDTFVGRENRAQCIVEAAARQLRHEHQPPDPEEERQRRIAAARAALDRVAGSLSDVDVPGWEATESTVEWVHGLRNESGFLSTPPVGAPDPKGRDICWIRQRSLTCPRAEQASKGSWTR